MPPKPRPRPRPPASRRRGEHPLDPPTSATEDTSPATPNPPEPPAPEPAPVTPEAEPVKPAPEPELEAAPAEPDPTPVKPAPAPTARPSTSLQVRHSAPPASAPTPEWTTPPVDATPADVPRATQVLNQRTIKRRTLNASVPEVLRLGSRLDHLRLACRAEHIPAADFVALAVDRFLRADEPDRSLLDEPWCDFTGEGTPSQVPHAAQVLDQRFIHRQMLRAAVPQALDLHHRLERFRLEYDIRHIPMGDIVALAVDRFLRLMDA